jgi:hypothetical protein
MTMAFREKESAGPCTTFFMKLHHAKSAIEVIKFFSMVQDLRCYFLIILV